MCDIGVNTDSISIADKGTSLHVQLEDKPVNTDDGFQTQQVLVRSIEEAREEVVHLKQQNLQLKEKLLKVTSSVRRMEDDDHQTHFYTGLPSYAVFMSLLTSLAAVIPTGSSGCELQAGDQLLLVLMKLKLAVLHEDLAYRFSLDVAKV